MKIRWIIPIALATVMAYSQIAPAYQQFMRSINESMTQMDHAMVAAPMTGDVDHDFAAMMIPHHEGAIAMAKAELSFGKDPVMRRLAQEILADQTSEIQAMQLWIGKQKTARNP